MSLALTRVPQRLQSRRVSSIAILALLLALITLTSIYDDYSSLFDLSHNFHDSSTHAAVISTTPREPNAEPQAIRISGVKSKYAFATFLTATDDDLPYSEDKYLIAVRILTYQLLHDPSTRTRDPTTPFLVLVNDKVRPAARERLRKDGAIVVPVPKLTASWLKPHRSAWQDVMTKLRLWELLDFERVAFLDADTLLARPLDDVFTDPAAVEQRTLPGYKGAVPGAATPPETYVFAGNANHVHVWMDAKGRTDHLCAGFFVLKPDLALLRYYISILQIPESFMSQAPEEALLNVAHQWGQGMPWLQLNTTLNVRLPGMADLEEGARSAHVKWWESAPGNVKKWMLEWRGRMEDFYETRDRRRG